MTISPPSHLPGGLAALPPTRWSVVARAGDRDGGAWTDALEAITLPFGHPFREALHLEPQALLVEPRGRLDPSGDLQLQAKPAALPFLLIKIEAPTGTTLVLASGLPKATRFQLVPSKKKVVTDPPEERASVSAALADAPLPQLGVF